MVYYSTAVLDIIHHPAFYLKKNSILETGFYLHLQMEPTQMGPIERASLCLWTPSSTTTGFIKVFVLLLVSGYRD
jgi:hypothetical protein